MNIFTLKQTQREKGRVIKTKTEKKNQIYSFILLLEPNLFEIQFNPLIKNVKKLDLFSFKFSNLFQIPLHTLSKCKTEQIDIFRLSKC